MKLVTPKSEITAQIWACPHCGTDYHNPDPHPNAIACCSEVGHLEKAYIVKGHDDIVLESEILIVGG